MKSVGTLENYKSSGEEQVVLTLTVLSIPGKAPAPAQLHRTHLLMDFGHE